MKLRYTGPGVSRDLEAHELKDYDVDELVRRGYYVPVAEEGDAPALVADPGDFVKAGEAPPVAPPQPNPFWLSVSRPQAEEPDIQQKEEEAN